MSTPTLDATPTTAAPPTHAHKGLELAVKKEFLIPDPRPQTVEVTAPEGGDAPTAGQPAQQQQQGKMSKKQWKKQKAKGGSNRDRAKPVQLKRQEQLCPMLQDLRPGQDEPKCQFPNCVFMHNAREYVEKKGEDLGEECQQFNQFGKCRRGITCRFGKSHIQIEGDRVFNLEDAAKVAENADTVQVMNKISGELKLKLRKKQDLGFEKVDALVNRLFQEREEVMKEREKQEEDERKRKQAIREGTNGDKKPEEKVEAVTEPEAKKPKIEEEKVVIEEGIVTAMETERKKLDWKDKTYLAPLTTVGNLPFRRVCKNFGVDITCGEMAMTQQLLQGHMPEWALVQRHRSEDFFGIQVCGCSPQQMVRLAQVVEEHVDCDFVDINMGCPIDLVYQRGMGSGLMGRKKPLEVMTRAMSQVLNRPLTIKMRMGIYNDKRIAHQLIPSVREWGAEMVVLHGRSREQRYTKLADWDYVAECVKVAGDMPLYGNGDVMNFEEYERSKASGVSGIMVARGALIKPWVFTEIKERRHWDISATERLDMIKDYCNHGLEHWGSDSKGVENTRRFLLEWLSFLHRYVPVGLLERPPQSINQRIPFYQGRTELETMLSSSDSKDWIKITEMFLGKVPDTFAFEAKHKAQSYK